MSNVCVCRVCENEIVFKVDMVKCETISVNIKTLYLLESRGGGGILL